MANYAIGSIIIADIRARVKEQHGDFTTGDPTWYAYMTDHIYKFGLSRSSGANVITGLSRKADQRERDSGRHAAHGGAVGLSSSVC